ncbi:hypothetical protein GOODEAATRI_002546, partial [Goodea atripinnis]
VYATGFKDFCSILSDRMRPNSAATADVTGLLKRPYLLHETLWAGKCLHVATRGFCNPQIFLYRQVFTQRLFEAYNYACVSVCLSDENSDAVGFSFHLISIKRWESP